MFSSQPGTPNNPADFASFENELHPYLQADGAMVVDLNDVVGRRGERVVELCLTDYRPFQGALFRPCFLGDKWPAIDFYVELISKGGARPFFFAQAKATAAPLAPRARTLRVSTKRADVERLLGLPGPTYILGVHEPTRRVFIRAVHSGSRVGPITGIPFAHELNSLNLQRLHDEVAAFWSAPLHKPQSSVFA